MFIYSFITLNRLFIYNGAQQVQVARVTYVSTPFCSIVVFSLFLHEAVVATRLLDKTSVRLMPISHRRHGQDKTVLSCPRLRCELGIRIRVSISIKVM